RVFYAQLHIVSADIEANLTVACGTVRKSPPGEIAAIVPPAGTPSGDNFCLVATPPPSGPDMNLSELCIRRPVLTTLVTATFIVAGIFGYRLLSVAALPAVDFPTISITATLPGASAETMAASVAAP